MKKKLLVSVLAVVMTISMIPAYALADSGQNLKQTVQAAEQAAQAAEEALGKIGAATADLDAKIQAVADAAAVAEAALAEAETADKAALKAINDAIKALETAKTMAEKKAALRKAQDAIDAAVAKIAAAVNNGANQVVAAAEEVIKIANGVVDNANAAAAHAGTALAKAQEAEGIYSSLLQDAVNKNGYNELADAENARNAAWNAYAAKQNEADKAEADQAEADVLLAAYNTAQADMESALDATGDAALPALQADRQRARNAALDAQAAAREAREKAAEVCVETKDVTAVANQASKAVDRMPPQENKWEMLSGFKDLKAAVEKANATDLREWETVKGYAVKDAIYMTGSQHNKYTNVGAGNGYLNKRYQDKDSKKYYVKDKDGNAIEATGNGNNYVNVGAGNGDLVIIETDPAGKYALINGQKAMMKGHYANVGAGNGSYNYVKGVWVLVGEGNGEYLPGDGYGFVIVGEGNGDYRKLVDGYLNVDAGNGDYIATAPEDLISGYMDEDGNVITNADLSQRFHSFVRLYKDGYHKNVGYQVNMPKAADLHYLVFMAKNGEWFIWSNGKAIDTDVVNGFVKKFGLAADKYRADYNFSGFGKNDNVFKFDRGNGTQDWAQYWVEQKDYGYEIHIANRNSKDKNAPNYQADCMDGEDVLKGLYRVYGAPGELSFEGLNCPPPTQVIEKRHIHMTGSQNNRHTNVGPGNGDYNKVGSSYTYVGEGNGSYIITAPDDLISGYMDDNGEVILNADLSHRFHSFVRLYKEGYHKNVGYQVNMPKATDLHYLVFTARNGDWFIWSNGKTINDRDVSNFAEKLGLDMAKYRAEYNFSGFGKNDNVLKFDKGNGKEDWARYWVEEKEYGYEIHLVNLNTKDKNAPNYQGDCIDGDEILNGLYRVYGKPNACIAEIKILVSGKCNLKGLPKIPSIDKVIVKVAECNREVKYFIYQGMGYDYNDSNYRFEEYPINSAYTIEGNMFTREGYEFVCWSRSGSGKTYGIDAKDIPNYSKALDYFAPGFEVKLSNSYTFYGVWKEIPKEVVPEKEIPEEVVPEKEIPEEVVPEKEIPEEVAPEEVIPGKKIPDGAILDEESAVEEIPVEEIPEA